MIVSFADKTTQDIFDGTNSRIARKIPKALHSKARRLLDQMNAVTDVQSLRVPPSNRLEKLRGKLKDFWSLRINKQWRIVFRWEEADALDVKIVDYH